VKAKKIVISNENPREKNMVEKFRIANLRQQPKIPHQGPNLTDEGDLPGLLEGVDDVLADNLGGGMTPADIIAESCSGGSNTM